MNFLKVKHEYPLIIGISFLIIIAILHDFGIVINITSSMKRGLYRKSVGEIKRGDILSFCLHDPHKTLGLSRSYIEHGKKCAGSDPLVKAVIAIPGDHVILTNDYIEVNQRKYFYPTLFKDSVGKTLEVYPRGDYPKTQDYWVVGIHAVNSWDSRYWGPVSKDRILYKLLPFLTW